MLDRARPILNDLASMLTAQLQKELTAQGHNNTGKLHDSIEVMVLEKAEAIIFQGQAEFYGKFVDKGRKPGVKGVPIAALMDWIRQRRIASDIKQVRGIAFAIQKKIIKEGSPTRGAFKFSKNTRRLQWIDKSLENQLPQIERMVTEAINAEVLAFSERITSNPSGR